MNPDAAVGVVAKSLVPEASVATLITPEAAELRRTYEATKATDPYAALRAPEETTDLSTLDVDREVGRRISETPPTPGARNLRAEAMSAAQEAKIIAEQGLDGIKNPDGTPNTIRQNQIFGEYITQVLDRRPGLDILTRAEKEAIARDELGKRPEIRTRIAELLKAGLNPNVETETEEDRTLAAKNVEKAAKQKELADNQAAITKATQEAQDLQDLFARYQTDPATGTDGDLLVRIKDAQGQINGTRAAFLRNSLNTAYGRDKDQYATDRATVINNINNGIDIDPADTNLVQIEELIKLENAQREYNKLSAERAALPQAILGKRAEIDTLTADQEALTLERTAIDVQIAPLAQRRLAREIAKVAELSQLVTKAGNQVLDARVDKAAAAYKAILAEKEKAAQDQDDKRLYEGLASRWEIKGSARDGKPTFKPRRDRVERDWQRIITSGDVIPQVEEILTINLRYKGTDTPQDTDRKIQEIRRIQERLRTDKPFAEKAKAEYLIALIGKRFETGRRMSSTEQRLMERYGWMDYASDYVGARIKTDTGLKEKIERLFEKAGEADSNSLSNLREKFHDNWGIILPILISGLSVPPETESGGRLFGRFRK